MRDCLLVSNLTHAQTFDLGDNKPAIMDGWPVRTKSNV